MADLGLINGGADADIRTPLPATPPPGMINNADRLAAATGIDAPMAEAVQQRAADVAANIQSQRDRAAAEGLWNDQGITHEGIRQAFQGMGYGFEGGLGGTIRNVRPPIFPSDHPNWIPGRLVTSTRALAAEARAGGPDPNEQPRIADLEALQQTPELYGKNAGLLRDYPNVTQSMASRGKTDSVVDHLIDHMVDNLTALYDAVPEGVRNQSKRWYDGARNIVDDLKGKYGLPDYSVAGAIAAQSPQKDWFQNVSLAKRVIDILRGGGDNFRKGFTFNDDMNNTFNNTESMRDSEDAQLLRSAINGKSLDDIDDMAHLDPSERASLKALWVRMYDQAYNSPHYEIITPEGGTAGFAKNKDGSLSRVGWGSLGEIAKAVQSIDNPGENMSALMGERHKVRNFFNNILDPNALTGDVTIDTHAVAAALMRPLTGDSLEVAHNFGNYAGKDKAGNKLPNAGGSSISGIQGTYPILADAYRIAAQQRGVLPREMQSITWEAIRGLFPDTWKTEANMNAVDAIWNQYRKGRINQAEARDQVQRLAGGINPPEWYQHDPSGGIGAPPWYMAR
jgi:hypothetical protein